MGFSIVHWLTWQYSPYWSCDAGSVPASSRGASRETDLNQKQHKLILVMIYKILLFERVNELFCTVEYEWSCSTINYTPNAATLIMIALTPHCIISLRSSSWSRRHRNASDVRPRRQHLQKSIASWFSSYIMEFWWMIHFIGPSLTHAPREPSDNPTILHHWTPHQTQPFPIRRL